MKRIAVAVCAATVAVTTAGCQFSEPANQSAELDPAKPAVETRTKAGARQVVVDVVTSFRTRDARTLCASLAPDAEAELFEGMLTGDSEPQSCEQGARELFRIAGGALDKSRIDGPVNVDMLNRTTAKVEFEFANLGRDSVIVIYRGGRWVMTMREAADYESTQTAPDPPVTDPTD